MGLQITELLLIENIELSELGGKIIIFDASMQLYQFLSSIRQPDGTSLMDSHGNVTSHLVGISSRMPNLMQRGIKVAFAFDGKPPELKTAERERRKELKQEAEAKYRIAVEKHDIDEMKKYAARTTRLTPEMTEEAKKLIGALGLPVIQSPCEAEAQAAHIVRKGDAFAVATNDADALMFGAPKIVRNLSLLGKRKKANRLSYEMITPELIDLAKNLSHLGLSQNQLIALGMLVGTDFNVGGIKGIGPKNALKLVKKYSADFDKLFKEVKWDDFFDYNWEEVFSLISEMPVTDDYKLEWKTPNESKIRELLVEQHDFSDERVDKIFEMLKKETEKKQQKGLGEFFG